MSNEVNTLQNRLLPEKKFTDREYITKPCPLHVVVGGILVSAAS